MPQINQSPLPSPCDLLTSNGTAVSPASLLQLASPLADFPYFPRLHRTATHTLASSGPWGLFFPYLQCPPSFLCLVYSPSICKSKCRPSLRSLSWLLPSYSSIPLCSRSALNKPLLQNYLFAYLALFLSPRPQPLHGKQTLRHTRPCIGWVDSQHPGTQ